VATRHEQDPGSRHAGNPATGAHTGPPAGHTVRQDGLAWRVRSTRKGDRDPDTGATPAPLTSCNQVTASLVAKDLGIALGQWSFDIQGDLDTAVLVGGAEGNANFDRVEVRATVETDATPEQFDTLISETAGRCPVTQLFERSGLELVNTWTRAELPARV
jgi:hypothetical protein